MNINFENYVIETGDTIPKFPPSGSEVVSVFLHSANKGISLGSGASRVVYEIQEAEKSHFGRSGLDMEIQKIRKTPLGGVAVTSGGQCAPISWSNNANKRFAWIVHAILLGPRADNFSTKVSKMVSDCFCALRCCIEVEKRVDLVLPIFGVNNFGYPVDFMCELYAKELQSFCMDHPAGGRIFLWVLFDAHKEIFLEKWREQLATA